MGDRTQAWVTIHDCTPQDAKAVWELLVTYNYQEDWGSYQDLEPRLRLGEQYVQDEAPVNIVNELAPQLKEIGSCSFTAAEDAVYDWDGDIVVRVVGIGEFTGQLGSGASVTLSEVEVRELVRTTHGMSSEEMEARLDEAFGTKLIAAATALDEANKDTSYPIPQGEG